MLPCWSEPRATSAIPDIRGFIGMVLDRGHAYQAGGAVYFDVSTFPGFGQRQPLHARRRCSSYAAERGGNVDDPHKRDPLDFVLWQPSADDEPSWETMWGPGRPGWHIECSALALRELGTTIDLHGGGADLIFPHHECERAQSEAATGEPFVRHWMHQAMVRMDGEKMSKSLGNLVFVDATCCKEWDPRAIRLVIIEHHYRDRVGVGRRRCMPARRRAARRGGAAAGARRRRRSTRCAPRSTTTSTRPRAVAAIDARRGRRAGRRPRPPRCSASTSGLTADRSRLIADRRCTSSDRADRDVGVRERPSASAGTAATTVAQDRRSRRCSTVLLAGPRRGPRARAGRRPGDPVPEPHVVPRLVLPAARAAATHHASSARPSTWTTGRRSTSSRRWA